MYEFKISIFSSYVIIYLFPLVSTISHRFQLLQSFSLEACLLETEFSLSSIANYVRLLFYYVLYLVDLHEAKTWLKIVNKHEKNCTNWSLLWRYWGRTCRSKHMVQLSISRWNTPISKSTALSKSSLYGSFTSSYQTKLVIKYPISN